MKPTWDRIRQLTEAALALEGAAQRAFLDQSCADSAELRAEVEDLLRASAGADALLDRDALSVLAEFEAQSEQDRPNTCGPYRLGERLGVGGSAAVFLGVGPDGRTVAVKWLHRALLASDDRRRFEAELDVLRSLDHPGLVRPEAAGVSDGCPYLVTEYVRGAPIDRHCREQQLGLDARLLLFLELTAAVHHAHTRLVVHRDLKPNNVLVGEDGRPKVLDFGVAKLLDAPRGHTRTGRAAPHTPPYASPEQRRGEAVTTASDVYSLGVMLLELSTDQPAGEPLSLAAAAALPRDLRAVLRCATAAEPAQRYPSAHALAADVQRVLDRRPIEARRSSPVERIGLWIRRQPATAALAAVALFALVLSGLLIRSSLQRTRASEALAWRAHAEAVLATEFWTELLAQRMSEENGPREAWLATLERATTSVDQWTSNSPEAEARLRAALARLWLQQGSPERAEPLARRATTLTASTSGLSPRDHRAAVELLLEILLARRDPAAEPLAADLLRLQQTARNLSAPDLARAQALLDAARALRTAPER